jgi:hypothetical protein
MIERSTPLPSVLEELEVLGELLAEILDCLEAPDPERLAAAELLLELRALACEVR